MARQSNDPHLAKLAGELANLFLEDPDNRLNKIAQEKGRAGKPFCNVLYFSGAWRIRLAYRSKYYIIGSTHTLYAALLFADMAKLFFWRYRKQSQKPADHDFNFSLADAEHGLANNESAKQLLQKLETHLVASYNWRVREEMPAEVPIHLRPGPVWKEIAALIKRVEVLEKGVTVFQCGATNGATNGSKPSQ
jgi:hypothetical protein